MDVGDDRHPAILGAQFRDDIFQIGGILHRGCGDADNLATDGNEIERLLHAGLGVHGIARNHGLHDDGPVATHDNSAASRIAHHYFTRPAALIEKRRSAVVHAGWGAETGNSLGGANCMSRDFLPPRS